ncbi:glycosyltransferase [Specibacter sp. NPDC078692]|uniref:glycosyltransferase n=1 Tax=Specibacter sp. NPDC078692 TaxID=3155818 RepID=UPI00343A02D7
MNLNIIDGSAIWLMSMTEALAATNSHVTLLLKSRVTRDGFLGRIAKLGNVDIIEPFSGRPDSSDAELAPRAAAQKLAEIDKVIAADIVICRGSKVCAHVAASAQLGSKSWIYMTDIPHPVEKIGEARLQQLRASIGTCKRIFAQTRDAQSYLEAAIPEACGKTLILNPMVPDEYYRYLPRESDDDTTRIVYSGKFAKDWRTLEMCELPDALSAAGLSSSITMIGDKFQDNPADKNWASLMQDAIHNDGVNWLGGMPRDEAALEVARHDVSLSWRSRDMDDSFEISTKVLESAAMAVPPVINRTASHEEIFGADYPLFLEDDDENLVVKTISSLGSVSRSLRERVRRSVEPYSISSSAARLEEYFVATEADYSIVPKGKKKTRVLLVSHDFKFAGELVNMLSSREDIELRFDRWTSLHTHQESHSKEMLDWADVIICEWAGPNAVWYSNNKRRRQKLIVRLHMFELRGPWLQNIDVDEIDTLVCVSDLYEERVRATPGWEDANIRVIPNAVDGHDLFRAKLDGSHFRLGIVGIVPIRKRLDRAVDLLSGLLERDERYTLHVRGRMPWEYSYEWNKPTQQLAYRQIFADIGADEKLRKAIVFEPFGADMGSWMRKIGFMLSPSSDESFHLAPAEGMASGAIPVFWPRPGVEGIFGDRWLINDTESAVNQIHSLALDESTRSIESSAARAYSRRFEAGTVVTSWLEEIL